MVVSENMAGFSGYNVSFLAEINADDVNSDLDGEYSDSNDRIAYDSSEHREIFSKGEENLYESIDTEHVNTNIVNTNEAHL